MVTIKGVIFILNHDTRLEEKGLWWKKKNHGNTSLTHNALGSIRLPVSRDTKMWKYNL